MKGLQRKKMKKLERRIYTANLLQEKNRWNLWIFKEKAFLNYHGSASRNHEISKYGMIYASTKHWNYQKSVKQVKKLPSAFRQIYSISIWPYICLNLFWWAYIKIFFQYFAFLENRKDPPFLSHIILNFNGFRLGEHWNKFTILL